MVQVYPDSRLVRDAALGLARSLHNLGYDKQAYQIIDYIDKRWPRFYVDFPQFLKMAADIAYSLKKYDKAKDDYWLFYNLKPDAEGNAKILARLGDIYLTKGDPKAAKEIYVATVRKYPDTEGGLVARMRLAEEGIYDKPSISDMFKVFDRPYNLKPIQIYNQIVEKFPKSPLAPLAIYKSAVWYYWNKKYADSMKEVQKLIEDYPRSELSPKAKELGARVFDLAVPELIQDENYSRVITYWEDYDFIHKRNKEISDDIKLAVALSYWKREKPEKAMKLLEPYLTEKQKEKYSNMALDMALSMEIDEHNWTNVTNLAKLALDNWKISPKQKRHLDYAMGMAYENLGDKDKALPYWEKIAGDAKVQSANRAYALYYMAKKSMEEKNLKSVFTYSQEALSMFLESNEDLEKIKDCMLMSVYAAELSGRYREALKWAAEYDRYVPLTDPDWAGAKFRLANLYKKAGALAEWKKTLQVIADKTPGSLYGQMAKSALNAENLEQEAQQYNRFATP